MDVVYTNLETLIQRATNSKNEKVDNAATDAICTIIGKEKDGSQIATKLLANHIHSTNETEALLALTLLDTCMKRCGRAFHAEIGKFRFLNELIKLVSPKYLGSETPNTVRQKILELLFVWTQNYPRETKIKEAYEMLKNQGVTKDASIVQIEANRDSSKSKNSIFENEETAKLLKELLQSKDPFELQLANRLIKSMVKDDEIRAQRSSETNYEAKMESIRNNAKLLSEMLDSYNSNEISSEEDSLMKELYQACESFKPTLLKLAEEIQDNESLLDQVLTVNDELSQIFEKYNSKIIAPSQPTNNHKKDEDNVSLLDFSTSRDTTKDDKPPDCNSSADSTSKTQSNIEILNDIFKCMEKPDNFSQSNSDLLYSNSDIMQPLPIIPNSKVEAARSLTKVENKPSALEELNNISKAMLQQDLMCNTTSSNLSKKIDNTSDVSLKSLQSSVIPTKKTVCTDLLNDFDLKLHLENKRQASTEKDDDCNVLNMLENDIPQKNDNLNDGSVKKNSQESKLSDAEVKSLIDIHVTLEDVKPSSIPPINVINDKNDISVTFHIAEGFPHPHISVIVITTMSKNLKPIVNYMFQAVVPEGCKCKLQSPSKTELPAHNSFLPPSAITQIMLIANPKKIPVSVKFMLSYTLDNEMYTEMGEIEKLFNL